MRGLGTWLGGIGGAATIRRHKYCQDSHFDTEDYDEEDYAASFLGYMNYGDLRRALQILTSKRKVRGNVPISTSS